MNLDPRELTPHPRPRPMPDLAAFLRYASFCERFAAAATTGPLLHELLRSKRRAEAARRRPVLLEQDAA